MQLFLSLTDSTKRSPNENYARELMELFTLGSGYSEDDVREAARALTGFKATYSDSGPTTTSYVATRHDAGSKTIFGQTGAYDYKGVLDLVCGHPAHAPFLMGKLWSFFVTAPPDPATLDSLCATYKSNGLAIKAVVGQILAHPALYANLDAPDMVKAPVVFLAGALRAIGRGIDTDDWAWLLETMGQTPFEPPSVAGWDWGPAWLSTNSMRMRFEAVNRLVGNGLLKFDDKSYSPGLEAGGHLFAARRATGAPWLSSHSEKRLVALGAKLADVGHEDWKAQSHADMTQRIFRHFLLSGPDAQLH